VMASSSTAFTAYGITDRLKPEHEKYVEAFQTAAQAFTEADELFDDRDFIAKRGWKKETEMNTGEAVYSKNTPNGKMATVSVCFDTAICTKMKFLRVDIESMPEWDPNINYAKIDVKFTNYSDIVRYGSNQILIVSGREIIAARMQRPIANGGYRLAMRSTPLADIPESNDKVRAIVHLGAYQFRPHPEFPETKTLYDFIMLVDLKGSIPRWMINPVIPKITAMDTDERAKHFKELGEKKQ
ncbi:hypothetical protein PMAYCL1PPCAC_08587, partial [Pristionchus mayeri]